MFLAKIEGKDERWTQHVITDNWGEMSKVYGYVK